MFSLDTFEFSQVSENENKLNLHCRAMRDISLSLS